MSFEPGTEFGKYVFLDKVGAGGMAEIYKARVAGPDGFEKILVIKKILPAYAQNRAFIKMLIAEAKVSSALQHANIVQIYELGEIDGQYYIAMEYVFGADLLRVLTDCTRGGAKPGAGLVLYIISEICKGLAYAHEATDTKGRPLNIIHRDVSPSNILMSYDGAVKIMDFGVARADLERANKDRRQNTASGVLKGKLGYMSPEQVIGAEIDRRSDIFALGIILFEALTLKRLFLGKTDLETLINIRDVKIGKKLRRHNYISAGIQDMLRKALAKDPRDRYQTATDFQEAILDYLFENRIRVSSRKLQDFLEELHGPESTAQPLDPGGLTKHGEEPQAATKKRARSARTRTIGVQPSAEAKTPPVTGVAAVGEAPSALPDPPSALTPTATAEPAPSEPGTAASAPVAPADPAAEPVAAAQPVTAKNKRKRKKSEGAARSTRPMLVAKAPDDQGDLDEAALLAEAERLVGEVEASESGASPRRKKKARPASAARPPAAEEPAVIAAEPTEDAEPSEDVVVPPPDFAPDAPRPPTMQGATLSAAKDDDEGEPLGPPRHRSRERKRTHVSTGRSAAVIDPTRLAAASFRLRNIEGDVFGPVTFNNFVGLLKNRSVSVSEEVSVDDGDWSPLEQLTVIRELEPALFEYEDEPALYEGPMSRLMTPRLLYRLAINRVAGKLQLTQGMTLKEVFFQNGVPVHITSNLKDELLGAFMSEREMIRQVDIERAVESVRDHGGRLGDALVRLGMLKPHDLFRILELQFRTKFLEVFQWEKGWYQFFEGHQPPEDIVWMGNDTVQLLTAGVRTRYDLPTMRETFADYADQIIAIQHNPHITHNNLRLNSRELRFYTYLENGQPLGATLEKYGRTDEETLTLLQVIFVLHQTELLAFRHPAAAPA